MPEINFAIVIVIDANNATRFAFFLFIDKQLSLLDTPIGRVHFPRSMSGLVGAPEREEGPGRKDLAVYLRSSAEFEAMHQLFVR